MIDTTPVLQGAANLEAVDVISAQDVWAVGTQVVGSASQALIEHWDGVSWQTVESPNQDQNFSTLRDVSASSSDDVWAVGWKKDTADSNLATLIEHWDGSTWTAIASPNISESSGLRGVLALSPTNAWAVGASDFRESLIEHWDGQAWAIVTSPDSPDLAQNQLSAIDGTMGDDLWAVGTPDIPGNENASSVLIEHWDGSSWSITGALSGSPAYLEDVGVSSQDSGWAVGAAGSLVERWNGTDWSDESSDFPNETGSILESVDAISATNSWAAGVTFPPNSQGASLAIVAHWNGASWALAPNPATESSYLWGIDSDSLDQAWAVGNQNGAVLIEHDCEVASPTATPTHTPTASPTMTPTVTPTKTPSPTPSPTGTPTAPLQMAPADVDCSAGFDAADSIAILRAPAGLTPFRSIDACPLIGASVMINGTQEDWGDLNCDGQVNAADALVSLYAWAQIAIESPVGCPDPGAGAGIVLTPDT